MSIPVAWPQILDLFGTPLVIEPASGQLSGDAGLLPVRQFDERLGLTRAFAAALDDPRDPDLTGHTFLEMVRSRVYGILAGYEDRNDHDTLRTDPVFKRRADRSPEDDDLALLIKVAAEVVVSTRRIVVRLSSSWPHLEWYRRVCERLRDPVPTLVAAPLRLTYRTARRRDFPAWG